MFPIILQLPQWNLTIRSYETMIVVAAIVVHWLAPRLDMRLEGIPPSTTRRVLLLLTVATFVGGRLHYVINQWTLYAQNPMAAFRLQPGHFHAGGAVAGMALAAPVIFRHYAIHPGRFADALTPSIAIGMGIARVGCFLGGCCFGTVCHLPWCVSFPHGGGIYQHHASLGLLSAPEALRSLPVHPLQLYFVAADFLIAAVALWMHPRRQYGGQVALVALALFGASTAGLEFLREVYFPRDYWGSLPYLVWPALGIFGLAAALLVLTGSRRRVA